MAAKKIGIQRVRVDGVYVFMALFALLGSYTLLGSYADTKPLKSYAAGNYQLSEFATKTPNVYKLSLKQGLHYCLSPVTVDAQHQYVLVVKQSAERFALTQQDTTNACFVTDKNYARVDIQLPSFVAVPVVLTVQK